METYYRKRSRMASSALSVMDYQDSSVAGALAPIMPPRHSPMPTTPNKCTVQCSSAEHEHLECNFKIEVGSIYEVDHIYLPPRTPVQLRAMRVVMVSEKTVLNVAVRYPSLESLQIYFSNSMREMYPALDEKFVMGTALADKVLLRQVPSQEFAEKKHLESFWLVDSISASIDQHHLSQDDDSTSSKGVCLSELKVNGMVRWGVRRQVRFLRRHEDNNINNTKSSTSSIIKDDGEDDDEVPPAIDVEKQEEDDDEENEQEEFKEEFPESDKDLKRKRYSFRHTAIRKAKKVKREKQQKLRNNNMKKRNKCKMLVQFKNPKDRWSEERYKMAEKNLLEVMKGKGATATNPILRPELRTEARKRIGDTGLLDHLLKHMAGKVAPGGTERFRRRHNADGAMEYWLESADLVNVRKEAGVSDPYWIPPPGWKPGDCLTPDPISAHELKFLKNEIITLRRDLDEMAQSKKHMEEDVKRLRREIEDLDGKVKQQETPATVVSKENDSEIPPVPLNAYKEQLQVITSAFLAKMEEQMENFVHKLEEKEKVFSTLAEATSATLTSEKRQAEEGRKKELEGRASVLTAVEEKAAKIQRFKSGFRICKPQGTFLWPTNCTTENNMSSPKVVVQVEDLFMVPTPPSVSSSSVTSAPPLHLRNSYFPPSPVSPVKPVPERPPAVKVTVSSVSNACSSYTPINNNANLIYLNDDPFNGDRICGALSSRQTVLSSTDMMPSIFPSSKHLVMSDSASKSNIGNSCANEPIKSASTSPMPKEEGTWLALATPNTIASGESCQLAG
ncbi:unnamed protein product [Cuscuta epithymum]|uniref:PTC1-like winged helix-turn-helix domain-containing protein n=1 Tax=Cuscuta epithymum TaxID=186058 RepID=A0AAV0DCI1_9ASTE|nr:unnamed protein product [Cuscuta epithymum]